MSQEILDAVKTFTAGEALSAFRRVKLSAASGSTVQYSDAGEQMVGSTVEGVANGALVGVRLVNAPGTRKMVAAGAVVVGAKIYGAADGKVDDAVSGQAIGFALEAASADGDIIECLLLGDFADLDQVEGVAGGYKLARGQQTTVAASDAVVTGLATVVAVIASLDDDPVDGAMEASASIGDQAGSPAAGSILVKTWKNTDADATRIAATTFGKKVNWVAIGT